MKIRTVFIVALVVGMAVYPLKGVSQERVRDGVVVHLSHGAEAPQRVAMALSMAEIMSEDRDVLVYFDVRGIDVVLRDAPDVTYKTFVGSKAQLKNLAGRGVTLAACPGCLKAAGKTEADLAENIKLANQDIFFTFTRGRILTLDY